MKKGLLLCSGGMSTTMIAKKLNELFAGEMTWDAMGSTTTTSYMDTLSDYDFVFTSPQIRYMHNKIKENCDRLGIPSAQIAPQNYIVLKAPELEKVVRATLKFD